VEQQLAAGLSERQIAELIEDDEVQTGEEVGEPSLAAGTRFGLEPVDEVGSGEEPPARSGSNTASCDGDRQVCFAGAGAADQDNVALLRDEVAAGEVAYQALVDLSFQGVNFGRRSPGSPGQNCTPKYTIFADSQPRCT
jgi:hypothetical protein